jgi:hypothetical protein
VVVSKLNLYIIKFDLLIKIDAIRSFKISIEWPRMNIHLSMESHITKTRQEKEISSIHLTNEIHLSQLEHTILQPTPLPSMIIGEKESQIASQNSEQQSAHKNVTNSVKQSPNLRSSAKVHEILENPPEPRVVKVSKHDLLALAQMLKEFTDGLY